MVMPRDFAGQDDAENGEAEGAVENERFAFADGEDSLPWLEGDGDAEPQGFDTGRLIGLALIMTVVLGAIVGAIWWLSNANVGSGPEPDGSTIAAPDTPYKTAPEDEGGKTFAGTGDTSFAVGEGQSRESRLADQAPATAREERPSLDTLTTPSSEPSAQASAKPEPVADLPRGTAVQVGAYSNRADAEEGWRTITRQTDLLSGVSHRIVQGRADIGTVYRLQAVGGDAANARRLCRDLNASGIPCTVK